MDEVSDAQEQVELREEGRFHEPVREGLARHRVLDQLADERQDERRHDDGEVGHVVFVAASSQRFVGECPLPPSASFSRSRMARHTLSGRFALAALITS